MRPWRQTLLSDLKLDYRRKDGRHGVPKVAGPLCRRSLGTPTLGGARLSRRPIVDLVDAAVEKLRVRSQNLEDVSRGISTEAAELGVLALYGMVEGGHAPLLIRSNAKVNGEYLPEPQQIIERMVTTSAGIRQLGQIVLDVRAGREPRLLRPEDEVFRNPSA